MDLWRLFVALELPFEARRIIERVSREIIPDSFRTDVKKVAPEHVHVTMKFLGDVDSSKVPAIETILAGVAGSHNYLSLTAEGVGCFPNLAKPRVIYVSLQGQIGELTSLNHDIESALARAGFRREDKTFSPHLTIARIRDGVRPDQLRRIGDHVAMVPVGRLFDWESRGIALMRSQLRPEGPVYTRLAEISFNSAVNS